MSSHDAASLSVPVHSKKRFWILLVLFLVVLGYGVFLQIRVRQMQKQLVQEASSSASPLGVCQAMRDRDATELSRLRRDVTEARDGRIASEQKESVCLTQLGLAQQRAAAASPSFSTATPTP